jgi:hypothetical protein
MKRARTTHASALLLLRLLASVLLTGAGCWFSPGHEGFVCESSEDCDDGLQCMTFGGGSRSRRQCRSPGTTTISSKSGYTTFAIYLSWVFWIGAPPALVVLYVLDRRKKTKKAARTGPQRPA